MKRYVFFLLAFLLSSAVAQLKSAERATVGVSPERLADVSAYLQELVNEDQVTGGVVMIARRNKVVLHEAVGLMDREDNRPMEKDTIFRIASMTKTIISVAVMTLVEEKKIRLDDPVSQYIEAFRNPMVLADPEPLPAKREMTIRDLLCHTSGLVYPSHEVLGPRYNEAGITIGAMIEPKTLCQMMNQLARIPLAFNPGEHWQYGMSTDVLGRVIERASKMQLDHFLENRIFQPLNMKDTYFRVPDAKVKRVAGLYYFNHTGRLTRLSDGETRMDVVANSPYSPSFAYDDTHRYRSGGGGLCSTAPDYMKFCQMLLNNGKVAGAPPLLQDNSLRRLRTNQLNGTQRKELENLFGWDDQSLGFGYGFMVVTNDRTCKQLSGSYQWYGGYSTSFSIVPKGNWAIVVMLQTAWNDKTLNWAEEFKRLAAEAVY